MGFPKGWQPTVEEQRFIDGLQESFFPTKPKQLGVVFDSLVSAPASNGFPLEDIGVPTLHRPCSRRSTGALRTCDQGSRPHPRCRARDDRRRRAPLSRPRGGRAQSDVLVHPTGRHPPNARVPVAASGALPGRRHGGETGRRGPRVERAQVVGALEGGGVVAGGVLTLPRSSATDSYSWSVIHARSSASTVARCSGPWRSSAEVVMATSAPTISALTTSPPEWTPDVAAKETRGSEHGAQDRDPAQRQAQLPRLAQVDPRHHVAGLEVEVGLVEAVEEHEAPGAGRGDLVRRSWPWPCSTAPA